MCVELQSRAAGCENYGEFNWVQVAIQIVGLMKANTSFFAVPFPMTIGPPILLLASLLIQLAMYDHSDTYRGIDAKFFEAEISGLRMVRARRLVAEFNASLLIRTRQVNSALAASQVKLARVQASADVLLKLFYARLAGTASSGEVTRSHTEHLCSEKESVCSRGYSPEEAEMALELAAGQPDGTSLLLLETARQFALGEIQECGAVLRCRKLLDQEDAGEPVKLSKWERTKRVLGRINNKICGSLALQIKDVAFLSDWNAAEPLALHRAGDGLAKLLAKAAMSNSLFFITLFTVLAFAATNSVFDLIRLLVLLATLPSWPFPSKSVWTGLLIYSVCGIVIRAVYQLPLFCGVGVENSNAFTAPLWRIRNALPAYTATVPACPPPTLVGWDAIVGMPKMMGSSALVGLTSTGLLGVVWQDILVIAALLAHRAWMYRCGLWEHLRVGSVVADSGAVIFPTDTPRVDSSVMEEETQDPVARDSEPTPDHIAMAEGGASVALEGMDHIAELGDTNADYLSVDDVNDIQEESSPVGSFVDLDCVALSAEDRTELSRYAVQRHMSCEDVYWRLSSEPTGGQTDRILRLLQVYKQMRWDAQIEYANHACVRVSRAERIAAHESNQQCLRNLPRLSWLFVKMNPFYAVKVGLDLYTYIFTASLMMFFHTIVFYPAMTGSSSTDFVSSLKRSRFSSGLALLMAFHFVLIVFDRAYYVASFRRSNSWVLSPQRGPRFNPPGKQQVYWFLLRASILVGLTITLHAVIMRLLFKAAGGASYSSLIQNPALCIYYVEFMAYLVVSVLQLREGFPRLMTESLRPEKSYHTITDKLQEIRFIVYRAIPFLDELRILIDWTVSRTSLDLLQYFKLEDAHTYMWTTKREMEARKKLWPGEPIPKLEKGFMGCGFLLLLMLVIIGPVILFSTLVSSGTVAPISKASLSVSLVLQTAPQDGPLGTLQLGVYAALPAVVDDIPLAEASLYVPPRTELDQASTVQALAFMTQSDVPVSASPERFSVFASSVSGAVMIDIQAVLTYKRESADGSYIGPDTSLRMPSCACRAGFAALCRGCHFGNASESALQFDSMLAAVSGLVNGSNLVVLVPNLLPPVIRLDAAGTMIHSALFSNSSMVLSVVNGSGFAAGWDDNCGLQFAGVCPGITNADLLTNGTDILFPFVMAPIISSGDGTSGALLSVGIVTVYITIVYAIGRFLRIVFDKESLRVIHLEIPRPDDFLDLATGAGIARHYKDLPMEFRLYNCLIKVMRSPETLIVLGGADLTGYGTGRHDDPPHPEMLCDEDRERLRRRRRRKSRK